MRKIISIIALFLCICILNGCKVYTTPYYYEAPSYYYTTPYRYYYTVPTYYYYW